MGLFISKSFWHVKAHCDYYNVYLTYKVHNIVHFPHKHLWILQNTSPPSLHWASGLNKFQHVVVVTKSVIDVQYWPVMPANANTSELVMVQQQFCLLMYIYWQLLKWSWFRPDQRGCVSNLGRHFCNYTLKQIKIELKPGTESSHVMIIQTKDTVAVVLLYSLMSCDMQALSS